MYFFKVKSLFCTNSVNYLTLNSCIALFSLNYKNLNISIEGKYRSAPPRNFKHDLMLKKS